MPQTLGVPTIAEIRSQFPALKGGFAFLENAGGSQMPRQVIDAITSYLRESYVQLGAGYPAAAKATEEFDLAREIALTLLGGDGFGKAIFGASTSALCRMVADAYADVWNAGDEVIVQESSHEAHIGPWVRLEKIGIVPRLWKIDPSSMTNSVDQFEALLSPKTKLVALTHVSNLLGEVADIADLTSRAKRVGARVFVDGVAYAPHRAVDAGALNVDFYSLSAYKVFGPHLGLLYASSDALAEIRGSNHFFIPDGSPYKFELGCVPHELCAGLKGVAAYLSFLAGDVQFSRGTVEAAFDLIQAFELPLQARIIDYLDSHPRTRLIGPSHTGFSRVPTVSFVHESLRPQDVVAAVDRAGIGIRYGHMYAYRLCQALGIETGGGVIRVSLVHYNTLEEVDRLIDVLDGVL